MSKTFSNSIDRIIIPKIGVDAPISFKKVGKDGQMPMPNTPDDIAYYDFSLFPNLGGRISEPGNAIFSGHVDSGFDYCDFGKTPPPCDAVLWNLDKLMPLDKIEIKYKGKSLLYAVVSNKQINLLVSSWKKVLKSTKTETVTIITCAGEFNEEKISYDARQVVKARRVE